MSTSLKACANCEGSTLGLKVPPWLISMHRPSQRGTCVVLQSQTYTRSEARTEGPRSLPCHYRCPYSCPPRGGRWCVSSNSCVAALHTSMGSRGAGTLPPLVPPEGEQGPSAAGGGVHFGLPPVVAGTSTPGTSGQSHISTEIARIPRRCTLWSEWASGKETHRLLATCMYIPGAVIQPMGTWFSRTTPQPSSDFSLLKSF